MLARLAQHDFQRALSGGTPFTLDILTICLLRVAQIAAEIRYAVLTHGAVRTVFLRLTCSSVTRGILFIVAAVPAGRGSGGTFRKSITPQAGSDESFAPPASLCPRRRVKRPRAIDRT